MSNTPTTQNQKLSKWQQALIKAEGKFLSVSGREEQAKIELGFASQLIQNSPKLMECEPGSIINAVINVARTGITLNPTLRLAYLVPRKKKGVLNCVLDFSYMGLVKILKDNKCLKDIQAVVVYEDEEFEEANSQITPPMHKKKYAKSEADQEKREYKGVYCQVLLMDNTVIYTPFMPYWEVLKTEKTSEAAGSEYSPWKTWRPEMIKKTKIKRDFKTLISGSPSESVVAALAIEEENNGLNKKYKSIESEFTDHEEVKEEVKEKKADMKAKGEQGKIELP